MDELPDAFVDRMVEILGSRERLDELLQAPDQRAVRVNRLKTTPDELERRLGALGVELEPIDWATDAFWPRDPDEDRALGSVFEHRAGHFFIQSPVSTLPVEALDPQPGERVLDLAAAPGSKTTHIAERMRGQGLIVANDLHPGRVNNLISNLDQTGAPNTVVTQTDSCRLDWSIRFDKVLVDAPCSTLGSMHKDWVPIERFEDQRIRRIAGTQRSLMTSAFHAVEPGGTIVYATCTLEPRENQAVVDWFLDGFPVEIETFEPSIGQPAESEVAGESYDPGVSRARQVLADESASESFFVARFTKLEDAPFPDARTAHRAETEIETGPDDAVDRVADHYGLDHELLDEMRAVQTPARWYGSTTPELDQALELDPDRIGLYLAKPEELGPRLSFEAATLVGRGAKRRIELEPYDARAWLAGEQVGFGMGHDVPEEWSVVTCLGEPIGCARPFGTKLPSYVPKRSRVPREGEHVGFLAAEGR